MKISPILSAGRDLFDRWYLLNILPQAKTGFYEKLRAGSSTWEVANGRLNMSSGETINSASEIVVRSAEATGFNWDKERRVEFWCDIWQETEQSIALVSGDVGENSFVGFHIVNNVIYGYCGNYTTAEQSAILLDTFLTFTGSLSFVFMPNSRVQFFINGVYKGEVTTNLPDGSESAHYLGEVEMENTEAVDKNLSVYNILFLQRR